MKKFFGKKFGGNGKGKEDGQTTALNDGSKPKHHRQGSRTDRRLSQKSQQAQQDGTMTYKNNEKSSQSSSGSSHKNKSNKSSNKHNNSNHKNGHSHNSKKKQKNGIFRSAKDEKKQKVMISITASNDALKPHGSYTKEDVIAYELPLIRSVQDPEKRKNIVTRKLRLCSVIFDFNAKTEKENKGIERKIQMLVEVVEYISNAKWWDEQILVELIECMNHNLFRTLPNFVPQKSVKGDEEEEPFADPNWRHLQLVYELCLRFLISNEIDKKVMQKYLHGKFVSNIIKLFESDDMRERDYLKTILHRIYGRFMPLREQIRTQIANECYRYIYGRERNVNGIAEFLDIFSSIINGFSIPVKEEHQKFLRNVLIPLHKCPKYEKYFQQLADCCVLFVNKEQTVASVVLGGLLKFWPVLSPTKQTLFLREMLNVIGALVEHSNGFNYDQYKEVLALCISKVFQCMESPHFQVADQSLSLWKDAVMIYLSKRNKDVIWKQLFTIFKQNKAKHWNTGIVSLNNEVQSIYQRLDQIYWSEMETQWNKDHPNTTNDNNNDNKTTNNDNNNNSNTNDDKNIANGTTKNENSNNNSSNNNSNSDDYTQNGTINGTTNHSNSNTNIKKKYIASDIYNRAKPQLSEEKQRERDAKWAQIKKMATGNAK